MPSDVAREEFSALEREVEGEKIVTRHIFEQTRLNSADLAAIKTRSDGIDRKIDRLERKTDGLAEDLRIVAGDLRIVRQDLIGLRGTVTGLVTTLPTMIADAVRQVLGERGGKA